MFVGRSYSNLERAVSKKIFSDQGPRLVGQQEENMHEN